MKAKKSAPKKPVEFQHEMIEIQTLKPHPRNYRTHPEDQIAHLIESISKHGFYRNVVIAKEGTILAGHGVVQACTKMNLKKIPVVRLGLSPSDPRALKILTGDNGIAHLGEVDDRMLTELLKEIKDVEIDGLLGTGYDEKMLANLLFITRPEGEIKDINEAAQWVGMPAFGEAPYADRIMVLFNNDKDRFEFGKLIGVQVTDKTDSVRWPPQERMDLKSVRFEASHA